MSIYFLYVSYISLYSHLDLTPLGDLAPSVKIVKNLEMFQ